MLPTKHLRAFVAVGRLGSVTRAGEQLQRAQSAVSRSIQELEAALGVPLFERGPQGLLLTSAGRVLLHRAQLAIDELRQAREQLAQPPAGQAPLYALAVHERRLQLLIAYAEHRHLKAAALSLGITQPAASMALRDLEANAACALFDRSGGGMRLNAAGELLLLHIKRALSQLRIAVTEIAALKGVIEGQVTVGALPFGRPYMLPVAIGRLLARHPRVHVRTVEGPLDTLSARLRAGDVDLILGALPPPPPRTDLVLEALFQESMSVIARADHPMLKARTRPTLRDALRQAWVLPQRGTPSRDVLSEMLAQQGHAQPRVAVESSDLSIIRGLLLETDLVSAASRHLFHHELGNGLLVELSVTLPGTRRTIGILRRTDAHSSPLAQLLIEELRALGRPQARPPGPVRS